MKRYFLFLSLILVTVLSSCKEMEVYEEVLMFTGTETSAEKRTSVDESNHVIPVSVTSTRKATTTKTISVAVEEDLLEAYNAANSKTYVALPAESYTISGLETVLEAGTSVSESITVTVNGHADLSTNEVYCLPLSITEVSDGTAVLETSRVIYLIVDRPIIRSVGKLSWHNLRTHLSKEGVDLTACGAVTVETWIKLNGYQNYNPFISSIMGLEEIFLLRVGDVTVGKARLQLAGLAPVSSSIDMQLDVWYHIAAVFDGAKVTLYVDGVENASAPSPISTVNLTEASGYDTGQGWGIGSSCGGRNLNGEVCEMRVWNVARSAYELQNSKNYVDPTTDGLIAYWRFDEGEGTVINDYSGNGADLNYSIGWVHDIRFEN